MYKIFKIDLLSPLYRTYTNLLNICGLAIIVEQ